jgi:NodT family efflux transporter outer membrane factor (OMF) lipoprotein
LDVGALILCGFERQTIGARKKAPAYSYCGFHPAIMTRIAIILVTASVSACGPTNQTERASFIEPPKMQQTLAASGLKINHEEASWPKEEWWHNYKNPELNRLISKALQDNQNLKKAGDTLQEADASVRVAGAKLLPSLQSDYWGRQSRNPIRGVVASYNPTQGGLEKTAFFLTPFVMTWELDFWGKNRAALEAAIGAATAQAAEFEQTRLLLTTGVARAYVRGYAYSKQLDITHELVSLRRELLNLAETRFQTGLDTADGIQIARSDFEGAIRREATVRAALTIQQDALARMIGEGPDATRNTFTNQKNLILSIPKIPKHLPIELLAHRPDLAAALSRAEAAAERIHLAKTLFLPSMDLSIASGIEASATTSSIGLLSSRLFTPGATGFSVVPGLHLPIFQAGRLTGTLEIQRAEYDQAVNSYNETLLQSAQQVADSLANIKRANTEFDAQSQLIQAANNQLQLAQTRLRDGLKDRREILQEQIDLLESKFIQKTLDGDRMVASVDLYQALGGGYSDGPNPLTPRPSPESDPLTPVVDKIQSITGG